MASKKKATKKPVAEKVVETPVEVTAPAVEETETSTEVTPEVVEETPVEEVKTEEKDETPAVEETEPTPEEVEEKIDEKVLMFKNVLANAKQKEVLKQKKIYSAMPDIKIVRN